MPADGQPVTSTTMAGKKAITTGCTIRRITVVSLVLFLTTLLPIFCLAADDTILFKIDEKGYQMARLGYYNDAALVWINEARRKLIEDNDMLARQRAGLLQVMATIAFEKAGNMEAYASWSDAIRYFLEGRTTWEQARTEVRRALNRFEHNINTAQPTGIAVITPNEDEKLWQDLESLLKITSYNGPKPGLQSQQPARRPAQQQPDAGIRYVPRPFAETHSTGQPTPQESQKQMRRGIPVETSPSQLSTPTNDETDE